jgi:hypothetical protein
MESFLVASAISFAFAAIISIIWVHLIDEQKKFNEQQKENNENTSS